MRLRVTVARHGLPSTDILWDINENHTEHPKTIAQLLEQINDVLPLESQDWGLEDYVLEVGGYECLHYSHVKQILRDEDRVV